MRWRNLLSRFLILTIFMIICITQTSGLSYRCENDQILIVQSFGNDTIRMHCQKLQLCGYSNLKCNYDREQPACGGKTNFVAHVNQLTPTGKVLHTCCDMTFKNNKNKHIIEHDGNDCFVYELPDGTSDTTPGSEAADIIKKNYEVVTNGFTVLKNASQIPEDFGGYTGYRLRLFMLRNKSPPLLIVKAIERTSGGYRVTICRPRCGKFNREGIISHGESISTFDKDIAIPNDKLPSSSETNIKTHEDEENQATIIENNSRKESSFEESGSGSKEYENKDLSKADSSNSNSLSSISSKVSSEVEKENAGNGSFNSKGSSSSGPKSGHIASVGKNGEWTAASWTSWTSNTWTTWSTQTWNSWKEHEKNTNKSINTRVRGQTRGDRVSTSELDKKIIEEVTKDIKDKGTDINDYDNLNSHETREMESREKGFVDNRRVVIINHNSTTFNNYIHNGGKSNSEGGQGSSVQLNNNNNFGNIGSSSNNSAKNKLPNDISQVNNIGDGIKSEEIEKDKNDNSNEKNGNVLRPNKHKTDNISSKNDRKNKKGDDDNDDNNKSENDNGELSNENSSDGNRSPNKKLHKNRSGKKNGEDNGNKLSGEKNNEDNGDNISEEGDKNDNGNKGNSKSNNKKGKNNKNIDHEKKDNDDKNVTDDNVEKDKTSNQNKKNDTKNKTNKNSGSKNKNNVVDKGEPEKNKKPNKISKHPENEGDEISVDESEKDPKISTNSPEDQSIKTTILIDEDNNKSSDGGNKMPNKNSSKEKSSKDKMNTKPNKNDLTDNLKKDNDFDKNKNNVSKSSEEKDNGKKNKLNNSEKSVTNSNNKSEGVDENQTTSSSSNRPSDASTTHRNIKEDDGKESQIPESDSGEKIDKNTENKEVEEESKEDDDSSTTTTIIDTDDGNENIANEKDILGSKKDDGKDIKKPTDVLSGAGSLKNNEENTNTLKLTTINNTSGGEEFNGEVTNTPDLSEHGNTPFNLRNSNEEGNNLRGTPEDNTNDLGEEGGANSPNSKNFNGENGGNDGGDGGNGGNEGNGSNGGNEGPTHGNQPQKHRSDPMRQKPKASGAPTEKASGSPKAGGGGGDSDPPSAFNAVAKRNCFAADTIIETPGGSKRMDELQIGDLVLVPSPDGIQKFEKIEMFYHRKPDYEQKFLLIQTESGKKLSLTELHLIPFGKCSEALEAIENSDKLEQWMLGSRYAFKVRKGECVISYDENNHLIADKIIKVGRKISKGIYSPITTEGAIVTDGIFTSCFSQIESQATQKLAYDIITMFYKIFGYLSDNTQQLIQEIPSSVDMLHQLSWYIIPFAKY